MRLTEKKQAEIIELIKREKPYRYIAQDYNISISTISRIKQRYEAEKRLRIRKPKKLNKVTKTTRKKLQKTATAIKTIEKAGLFVDGILDSFKAVEFMYGELLEINENAKGMKGVIETIEGIYDILKNTKSIEKEVTERKILSKLITAVIKLQSSDLLRIGAIREMKGVLSESNKMLEGSANIKEFHDIISVFFRSFNLLSEQDYGNIKAYCIEKKPVLRQLFVQWEKTEY